MINLLRAVIAVAAVIALFILIPIALQWLFQHGYLAVR